MASVSLWKSLANWLMQITGLAPCLSMFCTCLRKLAAPTCTSSGFSASISSGSGLPGTILYLPVWDLSARTVATTTAASGRSPL